MGEKTFLITREMIENANDYIPLAEKAALAKIIAQQCIKPIDTISEVKKEANETIATPQLFEDDYSMRMVWCMQVFLNRYFNITIPDTFTYSDFDFYAQSHPFNQLEKMKASDLRNKIFDILEDYKDFKKLLDTEIYNARTNRNDSLERLSAAMTLMATPEFVKQTAEELQNVANGKESPIEITKSKKATTKKKTITK